MKNLILISLLFLSFIANGQVSNPANTKTITMGGVTRTHSSSVMVMSARATAANYDSLRYNGTAYVVPASKKLKILAYSLFSTDASLVNFTIGSGTELSNNQGSPPAGWAVIDIGGGNDYFGQTSATLGDQHQGPMYVEFAAGRYPAILTAGGNAGGWFLCELVDV